jgi:hypothetical protein
MSRLFYSTTGTFSSTPGGCYQTRSTSNTSKKQQKSVSRPSYRFGDVVFVLRRLGGTLQPIYHHAGIVTEVVSGTITQILHFDPLFDRNGDGDIPPWELVKQSMTGVWSYPEFVDGHQLHTVFPEADLHIEECGPTSPAEIQAVELRIERVRREIEQQKQRLYLLHAYNCQHFAMEMRTGIAHSADANSAIESLGAGINAGIDAWELHKGEGDWLSSIKGGLAFLTEAGISAAANYMTSVQNRKAEATCRR